MAASRDLTHAHLGIFAEDENRFFALTPLAAALQSDVPSSLRSAAMMHGEACFWRPWGGHGTFLAAILKANPAMRGVLFDLPHVIEGARRVMEAEGVADRCALVAGDAMASMPSRGDAYVFKSVIVARDDDRALTNIKPTV